jgi:hypothetical protein
LFDSTHDRRSGTLDATTGLHKNVFQDWFVRRGT